MRLYPYIFFSVLLKCYYMLFDSLLFPYLFFCARSSPEVLSVTFIISPPCISAHSKDIYSLSYDVFVLEELLCYVSMLVCVNTETCILHLY
jgi:hypothetical protein